jgi:hypothetical protein
MSKHCTTILRVRERDDGLFDRLSSSLEPLPLSPITEDEVLETASALGASKVEVRPRLFSLSPVSYIDLRY